MPGGMRFQRPWDFDQGNKPIYLNDLLNPDAEVLEAMQSLIEAAGGSSVTLDADGTLTVEATTVELATDAQLTAHEADTTNVHGIADTSDLLTSADVTLDADGSLQVQGTTVELATDTLVNAHIADTTDVHGISDTGDLVDTATLAAELAALPSPQLMIESRVNEYISVIGNFTTSTQTLNTGRIYAGVIWLAPGTYGTAHLSVTTAGDAGSTLRIGLYDDDTLVCDYGTVASDTTGDKTATAGSPAVITQGKLYILMVVPQGTITTAPAIRRRDAGFVGFTPYNSPDFQFSPGGGIQYTTVPAGAFVADISGYGRTHLNHPPGIMLRRTA